MRAVRRNGRIAQLRRIAASGETVEQYNAKAAQGHHAEAPGPGRGGRRRDPVFGLRRCLLRYRRPAVRGRRYDCAVRNIRLSRSQSNLADACPHQQCPDSVPSFMVGCRTTGCAPLADRRPNRSAVGTKKEEGPAVRRVLFTDLCSSVCISSRCRMDKDHCGRPFRTQNSSGASPAHFPMLSP